MSSAICFNLDQSKILLSGNGLMKVLTTKLDKSLAVKGQAVQQGEVII